MSRGDRREDIYHDEESLRPGEVGTGGTLTLGNDTGVREIARRLYLGSWKSATTRLHSLKQKQEQQCVQSLLWLTPLIDFMFWGVPGARNILALRCIHASRRLDAYWKVRLDQHAARNDALPLAA